MIPKKIHYIWLGNGRLSSFSKMCINTWRRKLPDYEIIEWNEKNLNLKKLIKKNLFLKKCYKYKLWAFMSDYLRLYILYNEGGIYFDTDVEVVMSLDPLLENKCFLGFENGDKKANNLGDYIGTGIIGAEKHNFTIKKLLDFYNDGIWNTKEYVNTIVFKELYLQDNSIFKDCTIYPVDYFSPYQPTNKYSAIVESKNTYCVHWYNCCWGMSRKGYAFISTKYIKNPLLRACVKVRRSIAYTLKHH